MGTNNSPNQILFQTYNKLQNRVLFIKEINPKCHFVLSFSINRFDDGKAEILIKLFSFVPVADEKNDKKVDQSALQRYLAEMVWFPSASLSEYLEWEEIDDFSAKATLTYNGTKGSGIFYFDETGQFKRFVAMRFKDTNDNEPIEWTVIAKKTEERNGIKIPVECNAIWKLESKDWTWLKLKITHIEYNIKEMPMDTKG